jgi:threonine synthase
MGRGIFLYIKGGIAMNYSSTRNKRTRTSSSRAILNGIAEDGGLYIPVELPQIDIKKDNLYSMTYNEMAFYIMNKFFDDFPENDLKECIHAAYDSKFEHADIAPITDILGISFLELQHGPTQAFKDIALTLLPYLMKASKQLEADDKNTVILVATSGDTGKAALEGFANVEGTKVIVFYPKDGVSEIQKLQMLTQQGSNTFVIGLDGNFDDAQRGVKDLFDNTDFNNMLNRNGFELSSANSINIGRLIPQIVYYFYGYIQMYNLNNITMNEEINVVVPTGNFGNILAAYYAKQMGLPIKTLLCASNENNVLYDFIRTGIYDINRPLIKTVSPSMDILVSSNLERLLYEISEHNDFSIREMMKNLKTYGRYEISKEMKSNLDMFYANYANEKDILDSIEHVYKITNYLIDTHTAVGHSVYEKYLFETGDTTKTMIVSTASPFKFGSSVYKALGNPVENMDDFSINEKLSELTGVSLPSALKNLKNMQILHSDTCNPQEMLEKVKNILINQ